MEEEKEGKKKKKIVQDSIFEPKFLTKDDTISLYVVEITLIFVP